MFRLGSFNLFLEKFEFSIWALTIFKFKIGYSKIIDSNFCGVAI